MTLMLTRADMRALLDEQALLDALRQAFVAYSTRRSVEAMRIPVPLPVSDVPAGASGMLLAPGLVPGIPAYSVKVHAKFPGRDPAIRGVLLLNDLQTGDLLAMMESSYLTALRTGLAGALGADALARPEARTVAIIGAGAQGRAQLAALRLLRRIDRVQVFDPVPQAVADYLAQPCCAGIAAVGCGSLEEAMQAADIVITATWARGLSFTAVMCGPACTSPRSVRTSPANARWQPRCWSGHGWWWMIAGWRSRWAPSAAPALAPRSFMPNWAKCWRERAPGARIRMPSPCSAVSVLPSRIWPPAGLPIAALWRRGSVAGSTFSTEARRRQNSRPKPAISASASCVQRPSAVRIATVKVKGEVPGAVTIPFSDTACGWLR